MGVKMDKISLEDRQSVKSIGFLSHKDGECFSARVITENGVLTADQMRNLSEAAEKFGNGNITFTARLSVEIPGIKFEDIDKVRAYIADKNMVTGGTGAKVRPVVACKGTVCVFGLSDTQGMAKEIHKRFYVGYQKIKLPHKFKIAVGGCPNSCVKPDLNDFGIVGQCIPAYEEALCRGCTTCGVVTSCPMKASEVVLGKLKRNEELCNYCGRCISKCAFGAVKKKREGYKIYVGGRWGKAIRIGTPINGIFTQDETMTILEKAIRLYKEKGKEGERFGVMIERIGLQVVEEDISL